MNFAPYQSSPPESTRTSPPPARSNTTSPPAPSRPQQQPRQISSIAANSDPWAAARGLPDPNDFAGDDDRYQDLEGGRTGTRWAGGGGAGSEGSTPTDVFETSLGFRMEVAACLAYLLLPPAGGVILLIFEHKSDYVRYVALISFLMHCLDC